MFDPALWRKYMIEPITYYTFTYTPFDKTFPIKKCEITIYAKNKEEADKIAWSYSHKFFEQDCVCSVTAHPMQGYRRTDGDIQVSDNRTDGEKAK